MLKAKKTTPKELYWAKKRKEEQEREAFLPPGLVNHGNTCFMNSVIQGLVATDRLESLVRFNIPYDSFVHPLAYNRSPLLLNGRGPEHIKKEWVKGMSLGDIFIDTLERAWRMREVKDRSSMSPRELLGRLGEKYDQYLDFRQQDAHEFFLHLLDGMRMEEFDIIKVRQPRPNPKTSKRRSKDAVSHPSIDTIPEEERLVSFVDLLWGGKFTSVLICATCKHVSHTYEDFDDLSLSINHDESKDRKRDRLRAFASKFMSQSNRSRDQGFPIPRPQSASQPPSPAFSNAILESDEVPDDPPRRRSFDDNLSHESTTEPEAERRKVELLAGIRNGVAENASDASDSRAGLRSRRVSEVNLGKFGRRISVGMSLGTKKEKKSKKSTNAEESKVEEESDGEVGRATPSSSNSRPVSRSHSPNFFKKSNGPIKLPSPPEHVKQKAAYLRRLLEDTAPIMPSALALLRMANPSGTPSVPPWTKVGSSQSVEDCLRMFTAVEALDGDNMFGCRNCWKIANGQAPGSTIPPSDDDTDSSDSGEQKDEPPRSEGVDRVRPATLRTMSAPLLPSVLEHRSTASLSSSTVKSPISIPFDPSLSDDADLNTLLSDLNVTQSASTSRTSISIQRHTNGFGRRTEPISLVVPEEHMSENNNGGEVEPQEVAIPTIATTSPSPDTAFPYSPGPQQPFRNLTGVAMFPEDSLRLPQVQANNRLQVLRDGGESSLSSEESERDDTSGNSDVDASSVPEPPNVETRRSRRSSVPRAKQVIYRRALKRYLIARPPPVLVIHLKRFQQVSKSSITLFGNLKKLDDFISFPEYLDIRPFLAPKKEDYGLGKGELKGKVAEKGMREEDLPCMYRLYAVVVHIGNMLGGHYIAYTALPPSRTSASGKDDPAIRASQSPASEKRHDSDSFTKLERQWCYISDTVVRLVTLEEVLKAKAYLCMYERVQ